MREIKFRIWDKRQNEYIFEREACSKRLAVSLHGKVYSGKFDDVLSDNDYVIQQYTGLKDSKGKEIYEGDILQCPWNFNPKLHLIGHVVFQNGSFCLAEKKEEDPYLSEHCGEWTIYSHNNTPSRKEFWDKATVIGNIMQNPELLKQ